jgi:SAM-dependent methyltransferase
MSSSYRNSLNKWLSQLEVKADRVLDIGGSQEQMPGRVKSWDVEEYQIADLPEPHKDSPKPEVELDLNVGGCGLENDIDLVFCLEVMEYVWNPYMAFEEIARVLKPGGTAWVSFPSFYPLHQPVEDDALRYMPGGIRKLAKAAGLTVVQMIPRRPETNLLQQFYSAERLRAAKGEDHAVLGWIVEFTK